MSVVLSLISCVASSSNLEVNSDFVEPLGGLYIVYTGGYGTNKSSVVRLAKKEFRLMEKYMHCLDDKHQNKENSFSTAINNSATVECLLEELVVTPTMIQFYDEFEALIGSFGLYKAGK